MRANLSFLLVILALAASSQTRDVKFNPKGNPENWNTEITPFLVAPFVSGEIQSELLSSEYGIDPGDFIETLNGTFMISAAVSKSKFFGSAGYIYNYNSVEKIMNESQTITAKPEMQRHILDVNAGMRFRLGGKFILDPFVGFRYTNYHIFGSLEGILNMNELDEHADFWDPLIGVHVHYYPHPRVPIELKADIGGFGAGFDFTWSSWFNTGYTLSPVVDLLIGFAALSNKYENETESGRNYGMTSITYGMDIGARFHIPGRGKDPSIFKKKFD